MNIVIIVLITVIVFSFLILIHEFGHFIMAKRAGIKVEEFGLGLPPRIWGKKKGETIYSINWIPFGGFVRLLGEDSSDPKVLKNKRSFAAKSIRARFKVIVAGVVMNFLLAWVLLSVGFSFGMQPLLGPGDVFPAVSEGIIVLEEGLKIKSVEEGSLADQTGFKAEDVIIGFEGSQLDYYKAESMKGDPVGIYKVLRGEQILTYEIIPQQTEGLQEYRSLGVEFYESVPFPRPKIFSVEEGSASYVAGLRPNDVILSVNERQVFNVSDLEELIRGQTSLNYQVYRDGVRENFLVEIDKSRTVIVSSVIPFGGAHKSGLKEGDVLLMVDGNYIDDSLELISYVSANPDSTLAFQVLRDGEEMFMEIDTDENGLINVMLSELIDYTIGKDISVYNYDQLSSVKEIRDIQYPVHIAIYTSIKETFRISKMTALLFVDFVSGFVQSGDVPETVAGPVGIATMTYQFAQEGAIPLVRFVAILSLSLAVINILPFPALDGGRLLFIIVELFIGRKVPAKWESLIHAFGFILILMLLVAITYSDFLRLLGY